MTTLKSIFFSILLTVVHLYGAAQLLTSSNLPIIRINTNGQTIIPNEKITADMGIVFNGNGIRNNTSDNNNHYNGKIGVEIRGQSSQGFPMNSYNIELRHNDGSELDTSLLGLPNESDWVLYAPYTDKSLMHNFLAYTLSNEMGHWAAHCRYVEVLINDEYRGIYVLMEKIKRSKGRLDLATLHTYDINGDELTGGYIFSIDKEPNGWYSTHPVPNSIDGGTRQYSYIYPKPDSIQPQQKAYIKSVVDQFEDVAASRAFQDPALGLRNHIDYPSFVDYHIIEEVSRNVDGYRLSAYFHKDKASKNPLIFAGPVWDFDIAFHNANYCNGSLTTGWALDFNYDCQSYAAGAIPFFWYKLVRQDTFYQNMLYCRWKQFRENTLSNTHIFHLIDSIAGLTAEARGRHFTRWPILGVYVWPNPQPIPTTYEGEIQQLKQWLQQRMEWLDFHFPQTGKCWTPPSGASMELAVYPVPLQSSGMWQLKSDRWQKISLEIFDAAGKRVFYNQINLVSGSNDNLGINSKSWASGVYYIRIMSETGERLTKTIVK